MAKIITTSCHILNEKKGDEVPLEVLLSVTNFRQRIPVITGVVCGYYDREKAYCKLGTPKGKSPCIYQKGFAEFP